ncbi:hypothetical protein GRF29_185g1276388 [Pseudopithomyces chartarum]|uniref:TauD/TfdA-like domain-containing protein n=1 Tax=Pseudopithomyces chartarum TaxID=1892770 RepID=A0AAN6LRP1_9PLEO|nr:hypothetical protein GRF29_185g1276388 [Pseudopithomyces chartarum]
MTSVYSPDSASSSTTLHPSQDQYVSLDDASRIDLSDSIGTVFSGVQLSALAQDQAEELAKIVAERGVVFYEGQYDFNPSEQDRFIAYFDSSHAATTTSKHDSTQESGPEVIPSPVHHEWQSDSTHQAETPSLSIQMIGEAETITAETAWVSQYGVYDSLSIPVQRLVAEVTAFHGSGKQTAEHPAVRTHPITSLRALNIVLGNVSRIPQLKKKESDKLLELLDYELQSAAEHTIRWKWKAGDVALWDNRCTAYRHISGASSLKQYSTHVSFLREKAYYDPSSESRSECQSRIHRQEKEERERIEAIKRRYNNTPLRRIIARQSSRETTLMQISPIQSMPQNQQNLGQ